MRRIPIAFFFALPLATIASVAFGQPSAATSGTSQDTAGRVQPSYFEFASSAWFEEKGALTPALAEALSAQQSDSIQLRMLSDCLISNTHGIRYVQVYMLNPGAAPLPIERADATLLGISLLFQVEGEWKSFKTFPQSYCGNSFWQDTLPAHSYMTMNVDVYTFFRGSIPTPCKVVARIGTQVLESPIFTTRLTAMQDQALHQP